MIRRFTFDNTHNGDKDFDNVELDSNLDQNQYENETISGKIGVCISIDDHEGHIVVGLIDGEMKLEAVEIEPYQNLGNNDTNPPEYGAYHHEYERKFKLKNFDIEFGDYVPVGKDFDIEKMHVNLENESIYIEFI